MAVTLDGSGPGRLTHARNVMLASRIMNIRFYIDPETGLPHFYEHSVDEQDVEDVLTSAGEDRLGRQG